MAIYSHAVRTTNTTINQATYEIRSAAANRPALMEIGVSQASGVACSFGFGRPAAIGLGPTSTAFQADDPAGPAALTEGATAWATSPTAPVVFHRRINTPATISAGVIWTFPRGLSIAASNAVVLFNVSATVASDVWAVIDE